MRRFFILLKTLRVSQWIKNLVIFTAIIFTGQLFNTQIFINTLEAFFIFCLLSSTSYVLNDIIDYPYDKKHKVKRYRPIASGEISLPQATFIVFSLTLTSLILSLFVSIQFFLLSMLFLFLHFFYSLYLKKYPTIDLFTISFSFMIRTFAGEVVSGYHIPIWLLLTIFFISLFMASIKRHAELLTHGLETRESLYRYKEHYLDFLTQTFAALTIIAYATYTYVEKIPDIKTPLSSSIQQIFPGFEARKWMMTTIPLVVYGIARYAQLLYEKTEGERPEKLITSDIPLIVTIILWGLIVISLIYLL
ncbi:MAG: decaprenyl-phosphate phosphoribosyltransferase [Patescibacteria group bacterium]|nr:MAG: decaprenyl-phosphate phosphoribosyltransferase [Patescibacteria group bacterium]